MEITDSCLCVLSFSVYQQGNNTTSAFRTVFQGTVGVPDISDIGHSEGFLDYSGTFELRPPMSAINWSNFGGGLMSESTIH